MPEPIPIVVASDANFFRGLRATVISAVLHERSHPLNVHLLDGGIHDWQWDALVADAIRLNPRTRLIRHRLDPSLLDKLSVSGELTVLTYARLLSPRFVPEPFAIYLDVDFLISRPLSDLVPYLNSGKAVCAAPNGHADFAHDCPWGKEMDLSEYTYVNAGFLLMNLEKWRQNRISENIFSFLEKESHNCNFHDQTALNWLLKDDMQYIPQQWNVFINIYDAKPMKFRPGEVNLHFVTGMKPWTRPRPSPSHQVWWLFDRLFPSSSRSRHPVWQPRNLLRYASYWAQMHLKEPRAEAESKEALQAWQAFWNTFRGSE